MESSSSRCSLGPAFEELRKKFQQLQFTGLVLTHYTDADWTSQIPDTASRIKLLANLRKASRIGCAHVRATAADVAQYQKGHSGVPLGPASGSTGGRALLQPNCWFAFSSVRPASGQCGRCRQRLGCLNRLGTTGDACARRARTRPAGAGGARRAARGAGVRPQGGGGGGALDEIQEDDVKIGKELGRGSCTCDPQLIHAHALDAACVCMQARLGQFTSASGWVQRLR